MDNLNGHVMNLANSIIGVSILAMPYCFKQCGVILSIFMLLISSIISRLTCHFLLKSAVLARRKTFEFLSFHIFGALGKFSIEVGMIGFLLGTCIAFFVVMGDLGPAIISEMTGVPTGNALRNSILVALAIFCVLPLGLLRNVDSLNGVSKATIGFYCCLVLKIVIEALPHIFTGDWVNHVVLWRPAGVLQCLPIFSMALSCQTQIFEIYQALPNASLDKMNSVVRSAVNICTCVYIFVGAFGYIAFFQKPFTGNILLSFRPSMISDMIKMGFVLSLAFSFPLVIFPCRASLYSLLYKGHSYTGLHEGAASNYIPEGKFKMLTLIIVSVSLSIGLLIPTIELVLGLMGSTIGVMICVIFPVTCFICISPKNTNERILAQIMLFVGVIVMVLGTYANLYALEEVKMQMVTEKSIEKDLKEPFMAKFNVMDIPTTVKSDPAEYKLKNTFELGINVPPDINDKNEETQKEVRHEPPQPEEPVENSAHSESPKNIEKIEVKPKLEEFKEVKKDDDKQKPAVELVQPENVNVMNKEADQIKVEETVVKKRNSEIVHNGEGKKDFSNEVKEVNLKKEVVAKKESKKNDEVDIEAIKKEESELKEQEKDKPADDKSQILIDTIQKQHEVQKEIVEQQKKLIEVIQKQQENSKIKDIDKVNEEKLKAVKQIESIAKKAIESISGQDKNTKTEEKPVENKLPENKPIKNKSVENKPNETKLIETNSENKVIENKRLENVMQPQNLEVKDHQSKQIVEEGKAKENKDETNKINLLPLPMALAKLSNKTVDPKKEEPSKTEPKNDDGNKSSEDVKAMRRDILAENNENKVRVKRDLEENNFENSEKVKDVNKAVKEVCEEMSRLTSTEKPVIKMLCKLSEPALVQVDMNTIEKQSSVDVKPQKRDLKEFSED